MPKKFPLLTTPAYGICALLSFNADAAGQEFYQGKTLSITVGSAPGGSYDLYARIVANHIGRYVAGNPVVIVRNMPGAAGLSMANYLVQAAPQDGTALGAPLNTLPLTQILSPKRVNFNVAEFHWLGSVSAPTNVLVTWHTSGVKTIEDAKQRQILIGATTAGTTQEMYPLLSNYILGTKFKVITGYKGSADVNLAMENGEVQGRGSNTFIAYRFQNPDWIRDNRLHFLFQMSFKRDQMLPNVPTLLELTPSEDGRRVVSILTTTETLGRAFFAPPAVPADRVRILRQALMSVVLDKEFLLAADKARLEVEPTSGEEIQKLVEDLVNASPDTIRKFKEAVADGVER